MTYGGILLSLKGDYCRITATEEMGDVDWLTTT